MNQENQYQELDQALEQMRENRDITMLFPSKTRFRLLKRLFRRLNKVANRYQEMFNRAVVKMAEAVRERIQWQEEVVDEQYSKLQSKIDALEIAIEQQKAALQQTIEDQRIVIEQQRAALQQTIEDQRITIEQQETALRQAIEDQQLAVERQGIALRQAIEDHCTTVEQQTAVLAQAFDIQRMTLKAQTSAIQQIEARCCPDLRIGNSNAYYEADAMQDEVVSENIAEVLAEPINSSDASLQKLAESYQIASRQQVEKRKETIALICIGLRDQYQYEAITKETYAIYYYLKQHSHYKVVLLSVEDQEEIETDSGIFYLPEGKLTEVLNTMDVRLLVVIGAVMNTAFLGNLELLRYPMVLRVTAQAPLNGFRREFLDSIRYLDDLGTFKVQAYSQYACHQIEELGLRHVTHVFPVLSVGKVRERKQFTGPFIVGFASSPMLETQVRKRGMFLLAEVAALTPDVQYIVLWRDENVPVPESLKLQANVTLRFGIQDMEAFYQEIDALILPYQDYAENHGCSFSAIESMAAGCPVICTDVAGAADVVRLTELGTVMAADAESVAKGVREIQQGVVAVTEHKLARLNRIMDPAQTLFELEKAAKECPFGKIVTLFDWEKAVSQEGRQLIRGHSAMKAYYAQIPVADSYTKERFQDAFGRCIDAIERASISTILSQFGGQRPLKILDVACGNGRIVQEDLKFGECVAVDNAMPMIRQVESRFSEAKNLRCLKADYFLDAVDGTYDVITTFRYLRHFAYIERKQLYSRFRANLRDRGLLILDVPNRAFELYNRAQNGWGKYNIYDVFWTKETMIQELEENGFQTEYILTVGSETVEGLAKEPVSWTFGAIKR